MENKSSPLAVKRRRVTAATTKLTKPFVSPMRSTETNRTETEARNCSAVYTPSGLAHTSKAPSKGSSLIATPTKVPGQSPKRAADKPVLKRHTLTPWSNKTTDPSELAARRALMALENQITTVRNDIDTLNHAQQITTSAKGSELDALSDKWRVASQQAAEELFVTVKERVCHMGGVAAWRETEKRKYERSNGNGDSGAEPEFDDDADCEFDSQGEELPEEEQASRKKQKRRVRRELMDAADVEEREVEREWDGKLRVGHEPGDDDDDTFTMDMMLRSLNIDLEVIGYDKTMQRWIGS